MTTNLPIVATPIARYPNLFIHIDPQEAYVYRRTKILLPDGPICVVRTDRVDLHDEPGDVIIEVPKE